MRAKLCTLSYQQLAHALFIILYDFTLQPSSRLFWNALIQKIKRTPCDKLWSPTHAFMTTKKLSPLTSPANLSACHFCLLNPDAFSSQYHQGELLFSVSPPFSMPPKVNMPILIIFHRPVGLASNGFALFHPILIYPFPAKLSCLEMPVRWKYPVKPPVHGAQFLLRFPFTSQLLWSSFRPKPAIFQASISTPSTALRCALSHVYELCPSISCRFYAKQFSLIF